ncbi:MAG TPA: FtsX-like permease family protein [Chthoniobacteraceae bacterium]|jgi:putative ABC transport system permease protein|nr:FtsX-like permease family protein [Chthoniobacteraceae bacterium]
MRFLILFRWHVARHARRHWLLAALNVVAVALGVAVFVAIRVANGSASRAFEAGVDLVAGKAQLEVRGNLDDAIFPNIQHAQGVRAATPVIEQLATLPDYPGEYLRVLGVDVFTNGPFRTFDIGEGNFDIGRWLASPDGIAVSDEFAKAHNLKAGDALKLMISGSAHTFHVNDLIPMRNTVAGASGVPIAAMDIGWAQEAFGMRGRLTSIQVLLEDPAQAEAVRRRLAALAPPDSEVAGPRQRSLQIEKMLGAFQLNLTAMSLVSLLVGTFLIYNTIFASAARRRVEVGILRSLGVTRREVRALFLSEAMIFGVLGIACGIIGGAVLAEGLTGSVARTVSSLYVLVSIGRPAWGQLPVFSAAALGIASVLAGAWVPANEAARADPVAALDHGARMERFSGGHIVRWSLLGFALLAGAGGCCMGALRGDGAWLSFAGCFLVLMGFAFFAPGAAAILGKAAALARHTMFRLAAENLGRTIHRSGITVAALACAVAMAIGVTVMIHSFRQSVEEWITRGIVADLFIAPASNEVIGLHDFVPADLPPALEADPAVRAADTYREVTARTEDGRMVEIGAVRGADRRNLRFVGGGEREKMRQFFSGGNEVIVTESFAHRYGTREGDALHIRTPSGLAAFRVAGIYYDYTSDRGLIMIDRALFNRWWHDAGVNSIAVYLKPGANLSAVEARIRNRWGSRGLVIYTNSALRQRILTVFDQTFAVTGVLRVIAVLVAIVGIFLALTALVIERAREIGVLRAIGASRGQVRGLMMSEAALLGTLASALGIAAGMALAMILTWVVNKAFFGWTIELQWPWLVIATTPLWIIAAAMLAAFPPAWQAGRIEIAGALREE